MLVILIRTVIIYFLLLVVLRLMGKRQLGELQPFEFVITLAVADLACNPMQDISIPLLYGIVPIIAIFIIHWTITAISTKSIIFRKILNGKPVIIVNEKGIDCKSLKKLNMNVNDLMESIRSQEYFSIEQIKYAIAETNGNISVLPNNEAEAPSVIPISLIVEGKYIEENIGIGKMDKQKIDKVLTEEKLKICDIVLMTIAENKILIQPKDDYYFTKTLETENI